MQRIVNTMKGFSSLALLTWVGSFLVTSAFAYIAIVENKIEKVSDDVVVKNTEVVQRVTKVETKGDQYTQDIADIKVSIRNIEKAIKDK